MMNNTIRPGVGVILAGGLSRRMFAAKEAATPAPRDKGLLALGTTTMIGRVVARLKPQVERVVVNANGDPARFASLGLPVIADPIAGFVGPLAGILAGLQWARLEEPRATHIISVSSDAPFLPQNLVERLAVVAATAPRSIVLARSRGELHPVIGCWPVVHAADLERALNNDVRKVLRWTDTHGTIPVDFDDAVIGGERIDPFFNANTPAEFEEASRILASAEDSP